MRDEYSLGPVPLDEECAQVGQDNYNSVAHNECKRYVALLKKVFDGVLLPGMYFEIVRNPHDFGYYYDVVVVFDMDDYDQVQRACFIEENSPMSWNDDSPRHFEESTE